MVPTNLETVIGQAMAGQTAAGRKGGFWLLS